jgi:hypothetical protein
MDPNRIARLFELIVQIVECLQRMSPESRQRVLGVVEKLTGEIGLAADIEELVEE